MDRHSYFPQRPDVHPSVYAYRDMNPDHAGLLKVGYTRRDVGRRVAQQFPVIVRGGVNGFVRRVTFYLNYSADAQQTQACMTGRELLGGKAVAKGEALALAPWGLAILEEA